jgi:replication-associated recombination protein RarA
MIKTLNREDFANLLHANLSPTSPIQSQEHLFGRSKQLQLIEQALCAPGRSIFIYGDRGVGKTSLAQTVAYSHQGSLHFNFSQARWDTLDLHVSDIRYYR